MVRGSGRSAGGVQRPPGDPGQRCPRQERRQRNTVPVATMAHDTSPSIGEVHQAAVLVPPALPSERHESVGPLTNTWPSRLVPVGLPTISTKASRAACAGARSEEHTSELQSLMRISYAVFCLKKKTTI